MEGNANELTEGLFVISSIDLGLGLRKGGLDIDSEELLNLAAVHEAAGLLTEDSVLLQVRIQAAALLPVLETDEGEVGGEADNCNTTEALGSIAVGAVQGVLQLVLDGNIDSNIEKVGGTEPTIDGGGTRSPEAGANKNGGRNAVVGLAPPLAAGLNLPVGLRLVLAPADHPLVKVLKSNFWLAHYDCADPLSIKQTRRGKTILSTTRQINQHQLVMQWLDFLST
jgi:hypothetical protein